MPTIRKKIELCTLAIACGFFCRDCEVACDDRCPPMKRGVIVEYGTIARHAQYPVRVSRTRCGCERKPMGGKERGRDECRIWNVTTGEVRMVNPMKLVGTIGLEPTTPTMSRWCSNQLSYVPAAMQQAAILADCNRLPQTRSIPHRSTGFDADLLARATTNATSPNSENSAGSKTATDIV